MMLVVSFVSLMVHIYTIGYMAHDPGYCRFFSYISLFTFSMLMLVMANNFLQLFFGWEAVGLVSYLLIGFWLSVRRRHTPTSKRLWSIGSEIWGFAGHWAGLCRVWHFGLCSSVCRCAGGDKHRFTIPPRRLGFNDGDMSVVVCRGDGQVSAISLHVWLPDSMEGPTPISALIHAATMVTAGIFMVARMSPLFELSATALTVVAGGGRYHRLFYGLLGLVQNDIKRVIAYSTLSQLGYMTAALGASAYSAAMFHLFTHAFLRPCYF